MSVWDSIAQSSKCPNCAANLSFETSIQKMACKHCGSIFDPKTLTPSGALSVRDTGVAGKEDDDRQEIICDSCGAVVITDENTSASFCSFCGSPALSIRRLSNEFRPDLIIPFKIDKQKAKEIFLNWAGTNKYAPKDFTSSKNVEKLTGIYVPFWLIDAKCHSNFEATGYMTASKTDNSAIMFALDREVTFGIKTVPFDGSKRISDKLIEAVEPFDFEEAKEFNTNYLQGFYAQRYDITAVDMIDRIMRRFSKYAREIDKNMIIGENYFRADITRDNSYASDFKQLYALLPVYFMKYKYNGETYEFAINGQTGEAAGEMPYSKFRTFLGMAKKMAPWILAAAVALVLLGTVFIKSVVGNSFETLGYQFLVFILAILLSVVGPLVFTWFKGSYNRIVKEVSTSLDDMPDVSQYFDPSVKVEMTQKKDQVVGTAVIRDNEFENRRTLSRPTLY